MEFGLLVDAVCGKDTDNNVIYRSKIKPIQIFISSSRGLALPGMQLPFLNYQPPPQLVDVRGSVSQSRVYGVSLPF